MIQHVRRSANHQVDGNLPSSPAAPYLHGHGIAQTPCVVRAIENLRRELETSSPPVRDNPRDVSHNQGRRRLRVAPRRRMAGIYPANLGGRGIKALELGQLWYHDISAESLGHTPRCMWTGL